MVGAAQSQVARTIAYLRAHGVRMAAEAGVNFALPFGIYSWASPTLGPAPALMAASVPSVLWTVGAFIRERRVDAISLLVLSGIALSLIAFAGGGGVRALQLRENLAGGMVGLIFLGSAAIGQPLIWRLARAGARRRAAAGVFDAIAADARFRRDMLAATLVWGFGLTASCAFHCVLVFVISIKAYLLVAGPLSWAVIGLLTLWTYWFVPRSLRAALSRQAAAPA